MSVMGRYPVIDVLGRGIMARVFLVRIPVIGRLAAAKRLTPHPHLTDLLGARTLHERFVNEAATLGRLQHPHICDVFDFDYDRGVPFYLMAYYGHSLGVVIGEGGRLERPTRAIRIDRAVEYTLQTLSGLACMHHAGLVHRDIKPHNLLLSDTDAVRIGDFGLTKRCGERLSLPSQLKVGSPGYAAPEQIADPDGADHRADLYAAGVVFYRLVTGHLPETVQHAGQISLQRWVPDLDPGWDRFIRRALAQDPARRFANAGQMGEALKELAERHRHNLAFTCGLPAAPPDAEIQRRPAQRPRKRPEKVRARDAAACFALDDLWRPQRYWSTDRFRIQGDLIHDPWCDCVWQQAGSPYPLAWHEALNYAEQLNREAFGGLSQWRLPTISELVTLLLPPLQGREACIETCFAQTQRRLWSADRKSHHAAWIASVDLGFVAWQQTLGRNWVRAVCDAPAQPRSVEKRRLRKNRNETSD